MCRIVVASLYNVNYNESLCCFCACAWHCKLALFRSQRVSAGLSAMFSHMSVTSRSELFYLRRAELVLVGGGRRLARSTLAQRG